MDGALSMAGIDLRESHVRLWLMMAVLDAMTLLGIGLPFGSLVCLVGCDSGYMEC